MTTIRSDLSYDSYDPYDVEINANPYPAVRRLREEAPLYDSASHDFCPVALDEVLERFPEWEADLDRARLSPTSTVRGWKTLPARIP